MMECCFSAASFWARSNSIDHFYLKLLSEASFLGEQREGGYVGARGPLLLCQCGLGWDSKEAEAEPMNLKKQ